MINKNMHAVLSQESVRASAARRRHTALLLLRLWLVTLGYEVLALCHFLCQAGSGHGSTGEASKAMQWGSLQHFAASVRPMPSEGRHLPNGG